MNGRPFLVETTQTYETWRRSLRDEQVVAKIAARIIRLSYGNAGDVAPVGDGVSELRIHMGPGYRVYFMQVGKTVILLLAGGDKSTQAADIAKARKLAARIRAEAKETGRWQSEPKPSTPPTTSRARKRQ